MSTEEQEFRDAIEYFAKGRTPCNCGMAYEKDGRCEHGCSTNQIRAKYELVGTLLAEVSKP